MDTAAWWSLPLEQLFERIQATKQGLTQDEVVKRRERFGRNVLAQQQKFTILTRFLSKLANPLILLLLFAAAISAALGQTSDFLIIVAITMVSITIDAYQEHTATEAAEKLRKRVSLTATVLRDGKWAELPIAHLVPGDVVSLSVGDLVPADCRVLAANELLVDESTLTGESFPQEKYVEREVAAAASVGARVNSVFFGTHVTAGEGTALVVAIGSHTELGHVATSLVAPRPPSEFEKGLNSFGLLLMKTAIVFAIGVFVVHLATGHNVLTSLLFVLALAIGFAPELLPLILTINLSRGATRMAARGVIVKHLPSIENFGSMDVLCTDKTGTLTENTIELEKYEAVGGATSEKVLQFGFVSSAYQTGFHGPLEQAILSHKEAAGHGYKRIACIPFDFFRKRVSVVVAKEKKNVMMTKGAPEELLKLATHYEHQGKVVALTPTVRKTIDTQFAAYGRDGFRVLAVAYKPLGAIKKKFEASDEKELVLLGFMAFLDPAKKTAAESLKLLRNHGVVVKVVTGDNELVTEKICRDLDLPIAGMLKGDEVSKLSADALRVRVEQATIFARLNPEQKVKVITALIAAGHVVGYMGDGVNDAPSLRAADIGISVNNAVDVAKESADIILLHKSLRVLFDGVREGRVTFANVMKYLKMSLSSNFGNMVSIAAASLFLPFLPILPIQILLNDLLYDTSQLTVAGDKVDSEDLKISRKWNIQKIRSFMYAFGPVSSLFDIVTFIILLRVLHASPALFQTGWFLESIVTQTIIIFSIRTKRVPFFASFPSIPFTLSLLAVVLCALILPFTPAAGWVGFVRPQALFFAVLLGIVVAYILMVELVKLFFYRHYDV